MDIVDRQRAEAAAPNGAGRNGAVDESTMNGAVESSGPADSHSTGSGAIGSGTIGSGTIGSGTIGNGAVGAVGSPALSSGSPPSQRDVEIDIHTDESPEPPAVVVRAAAIPVPPAVGEDGIIEVSDDEIEPADPSLSRASLPPPPPSSSAVMRSRPPAPPSSRPRPQASSSLPPPRHLVNGSSRPPGIDPWLLANKTLELSHAQARIAELEEQVAFRDARIVELEENLAKARRRLEDLESRSRPGVAMAGAANAVSPNSPVSSSSPIPSSPIPSSPIPSGPISSTPVTAPSAVAVEARRAEGGDARAAMAAADDDEDDDSTFGSDDAADAKFGEGLGAVARAGSDDDLQQISGIGPRFEAALRKHGITRLSQIAAWSEADVRQVAKALKIPKSRIVKGRWVEVAREVIGTRAASE